MIATISRTSLPPVLEMNERPMLNVLHQHIFKSNWKRQRRG